MIFTMQDHSLQSSEDVDAILRIALRNGDGSTTELRERLNRSAEELGISPEALAKAEAEYQKVQKVDRFMQAKRVGFQAHIISFLSVNLLLHVIWFLTSKGFYWPGIVLASWFVAIASHWFFVKQKPSLNDPHFQRWLEMGEPNSYQKPSEDQQMTVGVHVASRDRQSHE